MKKTMLVFGIALVLALQVVSAFPMAYYSNFNLDDSCVGCNKLTVKYTPYNVAMPEVVHIQQGLFTDYSPCLTVAGGLTKVNTYGSNTAYYSFDGIRYYSMPPYSVR